MKLSACTDTRLPELTKRVLSGRCIAFVGAGLSMPDYPDWSTLVNDVCSACGVDPSTVVPTEGSDFRLELMDFAKTNAPSEYAACLRRIFAPKRAVPNRYHVLVSLPFQSFITTNFDPFLLHANQVRRRPRYSVFPALRTDDHGRNEVFFIHGRIDPEDKSTTLNLVLTSTEFKAAYSNVLLPSFLQQTFIYNDVCFIGCSLSDSYLQAVFDQCHRAKQSLGAMTDPNAPKWFALADRDDRAGMDFDRFGVEVVRYDRLNSSHEGLDAILSSWAGVVEPVVRGPFEPRDRIFDVGREVPR